MKVLKIIMVILISCLFGLTLNVLAAQFDAPYYDLQEKNKDKWAVEDKQIKAKLAALEKKFGKKPNIYWATYTQQLQGSKVHHNDKHVDKANAQASEMAAHNAHMKQMLDTLKAEGISENTLVVWISDNGPMYAFYPNSGYSWLRGGKGDVLEGGVRVPAIAWWPGMRGDSLKCITPTSF